MGDTVEIIECRPMSKLKRWNLVSVVTKANLIDIASLRGSAKESEISATTSATAD